MDSNKPNTAAPPTNQTGSNQTNEQSSSTFAQPNDSLTHYRSRSYKNTNHFTSQKSYLSMLSLLPTDDQKAFQQACKNMQAKKAYIQLQHNTACTRLKKIENAIEKGFALIDKLNKQLKMAQSTKKQYLRLLLVSIVLMTIMVLSLLILFLFDVAIPLLYCVASVCLLIDVFLLALFAIIKLHHMKRTCSSIQKRRNLLQETVNDLKTLRSNCETNKCLYQTKLEKSQSETDLFFKQTQLIANIVNQKPSMTNDGKMIVSKDVFDYASLLFHGSNDSLTNHLVYKNPCG